LWRKQDKKSTIGNWTRCANIICRVFFSIPDTGLIQSRPLSIKVFSLARESVNLRAGSKPNMLSGLTSEEREVVSLKLGAELTNRSISKILGLSESSISRIIYKSLCKLKGCTEDPK
jgi:DNA-binding CsgD family transcriptional regulator